MERVAAGNNALEIDLAIIVLIAAFDAGVNDDVTRAVEERTVVRITGDDGDIDEIERGDVRDRIVLDVIDPAILLDWTMRGRARS